MVHPILSALSRLLKIVKNFEALINDLFAGAVISGDP